MHVLEWSHRTTDRRPVRSKKGEGMRNHFSSSSRCYWKDFCSRDTCHHPDTETQQPLGMNLPFFHLDIVYWSFQMSWLPWQYVQSWWSLWGKKSRDSCPRGLIGPSLALLLYFIGKNFCRLCVKSKGKSYFRGSNFIINERVRLNSAALILLVSHTPR